MGPRREYPEALREVDQREILQKIESGETVELDQIRVRYLDLRNLNLESKKISVNAEDMQTLGVSETKKIIGSKIKITNSEIYWISCKDLIFKNSIDFEGTKFDQNADFSGTIFCCETSFENSVFFDSRFQGAIFCKKAIFRCAEFKTIADFRKIISKHNLDFSNARFGVEPNNFSRGVDFYKAKFFGETKFNNSIINVYAKFNEACFKNNAEFLGTNFLQSVDFLDSNFEKYAGFLGALFRLKANFQKANFLSNATFMDAKFIKGADFSNVIFHGIASFIDTQFKGETLSFKDTAFSRAQDQEVACLKAKRLLDENGKREEAGYHFYREMEAKRKQKESAYRYFDYEALLVCNESDLGPRELKDFLNYLKYNILDYLFIQVIFGYGVHPYRLCGFWGVMVCIFALLYWIGGGIKIDSNQHLNILDYLWFSITVAVTPGFAGYAPKSGLFQVVAGLQAIFGTFMWAAFITTFAKKYMR